MESHASWGAPCIHVPGALSLHNTHVLCIGIIGMVPSAIELTWDLCCVVASFPGSPSFRAIILQIILMGQRSYVELLYGRIESLGVRLLWSSALSFQVTE